MTLLPWKRAVPKNGPQTSAFEDLALPLLPSLYNAAVWLSHNPADAEDLVQETFLKALRGFATFEPGSNFKAWIFRILRNTYLTSRSGLAAKRTVALEEELEERDDSGPRLVPEAAVDRQTPEVNLIRLSDRAALRAAMEELTPHLLEVILLCDVAANANRYCRICCTGDGGCRPAHCYARGQFSASGHLHRPAYCEALVSG